MKKLALSFFCIVIFTSGVAYASLSYNYASSSVTASVSLDDTIAQGFSGTVTIDHMTSLTLTGQGMTLTLGGAVSPSYLGDMYILYGTATAVSHPFDDLKSTLTLQDGSVKEWFLYLISDYGSGLMSSPQILISTTIDQIYFSDGRVSSFTAVPGSWKQNASPVPIPSSGLLLCSGLMAAAGLKKKNKLY